MPPTTSQPTFEAPGWNQFVSQYWKPVGNNFVPTFDRPTEYRGPSTGNNIPGYMVGLAPSTKAFESKGGNNQYQNTGWGNLVKEGSINLDDIQQSLLRATNHRNYRTPFAHEAIANANQSATTAIQNAFRDWQIRQLTGMMQPQTASSPDIPAVAANPAMQTLQTFAQSVPATNPMPLGGYASVLAALNAAPQAPVAQPQNPLTSWMMQYLRG